MCKQDGAELEMKKFEVNGEDDDRYRQWIGRLMIIDATSRKMKKDRNDNICSGRFEMMTLLGTINIYSDATRYF